LAGAFRDISLEQSRIEHNIQALYLYVTWTLYWLLGTSVQKEILWLVIVSLFLSARGNLGIEIVGESFSTTRENKEVLSADSHERHAQTAGESCKRPVLATWHIRSKKPVLMTSSALFPRHGTRWKDKGNLFLSPYGERKTRSGKTSRCL